MSQKPLTLKDLGMTQEELDQAIEGMDRFLVQLNAVMRKQGWVTVDSTAVVFDDVKALPEAKKAENADEYHQI